MSGQPSKVNQTSASFGGQQASSFGSQQQQQQQQQQQYSMSASTSQFGLPPSGSMTVSRSVQSAPQHQYQQYQHQSLSPTYTSTSMGHRQQQQHLHQLHQHQQQQLQQQQTAERHYMSSTTQQHSSYSAGSRIEMAGETVIAVNTIPGNERIIKEYTREHKVTVPKKMVIQEEIQKIVYIPEIITREIETEEIQTVTETIIEVAKPMIKETVIELKEIEYRDKVVEKVEKVVVEQVKQVPKIEYVERIVEVPKIVTKEVIVEVPQIEYREIPVEKIVEVPEIRQQIVTKEVRVPKYVEKPVPEYYNVEVPEDIERQIPVPVESVTTFEYQLVKFHPNVCKVQYPLYVPRFIEVPVVAELFDQASLTQMEGDLLKLQALTSSQTAVSLCEVENMAAEFRRNDFVAVSNSMDVEAALIRAWENNRIQINKDLSTVAMKRTAVATGAAALQKSFYQSQQQQQKSHSKQEYYLSVTPAAAAAAAAERKQSGTPPAYPTVAHSSAASVASHSSVRPKSVSSRSRDV